MKIIHWRADNRSVLHDDLKSQAQEAIEQTQTEPDEMRAKKVKRSKAKKVKGNHRSRQYSISFQCFLTAANNV